MDENPAVWKSKATLIQSEIEALLFFFAATFVAGLGSCIVILLHTSLGYEASNYTATTQTFNRITKGRNIEMFCPSCGKPVQAGTAFCSSCGNNVGSTGQVSQIVQPQTPGQLQQQAQYQPSTMSAPPTLIGIFKELEPYEKITYQGTTQTEVIFVKEAHIKKVIGEERKEVPISISSAFLYLTSKRLVFLKLFEMSATELGEDRNMLSGVSGTFYEMPLAAVTGVDMRPVQLNKNDIQRFKDIFGQDESKLRRPALEIIYDEKAATGRAKDYMESMMQRGMLSRLWGKVQMVYDKIFVLGEQSVSVQPVLSQLVREKMGSR